MKKLLLMLLGLVACGGMAVDEMPPGGVDGTENPEYSDDQPPADAGAPVEKWCIGCAAGVTAPRTIPMGYGLRPINETIGGRSLQFPACQVTESTQPHDCRTPTGNAVFFGAPPASFSASAQSHYWDAVYTVAGELSNAGWSWTTALAGPDPWDTGAARYQHTEVLVKPYITNSPHPLFRLTLQGIQNTPKSRLKTYLACEIEFDLAGPLGVNNNGGNCTGQCANGWSPANYSTLRQNAFVRAISRCVGLGGDQLPIYEHPVGGIANACWAEDSFSCAAGGGDGLLRKEWFPAGWWSQSYYKTCEGQNQAHCQNVFPQPIASGQYQSGAALLYRYLH